jgi:hypothetical protein
LEELAPLKENYPSLTGDEGDHPMTECATFADNIKGQGYSFQSGWHFINEPYYPDGDNNYPFEMPDHDIVDALDTLTQWLSNDGTAYKSSYYYTTIKNYFPDEDNARSFALRLVIHYVGDIHQPLHSTALVNDTYPNGDAGGNYEHLPNICGASNLHAVWDSTGYSYCGFPDLPLSTTDWSWYSQEASAIASSYPIDKSKLHDGDFQAWADQSFELAKSQTYPGKNLKHFDLNCRRCCQRGAFGRIRHGSRGHLEDANHVRRLPPEQLDAADLRIEQLIRHPAVSTQIILRYSPNNF